MINKVIGLLVLVLFLSSGAQALIGVGVGVVSNHGQDSTIYGYGIEVELPFSPIPMMTARLEANQLQTTSDFSVIPVMLTESFKFPLTPFYVGIGAGVSLFSSPDASFVSPSGVMNYSAFAGYQRNFGPLASYFIQVGYEVSKFDYEIGGQSLSYDQTGVGVKGGLRFGI